MKKKLPIIFIILVFLGGIGVLSYPLLSAVVNNIESRGKAAAYQQEVAELPEPEIESMLADAQTYNESLLDTVILTDPFDEEAYAKIGANYEITLDTDGNGLIGYIDIPKINVYLPIYHGTSIEVLEKGAGHLENTSMPIGGKNTHAVISAHSAFPTQTFFDYLTKLEEGDSFYVHVLNKTLRYDVDRIKVVLPTETSDLHITDGEDYVTLLTCTPYSVNTHRLLVRGTRVPIEEAAVSTDPQVINMGAGSMFFFGYELSYWVVGIILLALVGIIALIVFSAVMAAKRKKGRGRHLHDGKNKKEKVTKADTEQESEDEAQ